MRLYLSLLLLAPSLFGAGKTEILWDSLGVPHIFAADAEGMFYGHGWAQMQNQADLLLRLYGESRGRGAEYWGPSKLALDKWVALNGVPERAQEWYRAQDPAFRKNLDAFARGINDYAAKHPDHVSPSYRQVLPVSGVDVVQHTLRAVHYGYMGSPTRLRTEVAPLVSGARRAELLRGVRPDVVGEAGSNTWAVGPKRSASGKAMLIINPHLQWDDFYSYMEVHLNAPGYDLYGAPQIGFPVPVVGFNRKAGWGRTVNTIDTVDFYQLTVKDGKYQFDGDWKDFSRETRTVKIKVADGSLREEKVEVRKSVHGPVVFDENGITIAMRVAGLDRPKMLEQWYRMGAATNLKQFQDAMRMSSVPMWNANYADDQGHIMLVCAGVIPRRKTGDFSYWGKVVPGDSSKTLWNDYLTFEELPKSIDPASAFHQNANEGPWLTTQPSLKPEQFPAFFGPDPAKAPTFRTKRSLRMIREDPSITYDELLAYKHNTRVELADAVLPDLLAGQTTDPEVLAALSVLSKWDRHMEANSRGAVLFQVWSDAFFGSGDFIDSKLRVKYSQAKPLESAYGIADVPAALAALKAAAGQMKQVYGTLDVPYGEVFRFARGEKDLPGNGGAGRLGLFRTMTYGRRVGSKFYPTHGETFVCAIEFGSPQRAQCLLGYGNASQKGSKHIDDQLPLMVEKKLHPVLRDRNEIESKLEQKELLP